MSDKDFQIPESLKDALKRGQVVPFIGAGVSRAVRKKDNNPKKPSSPLFLNWKEFLLTAADKLDKENKSVKANLIRNFLEDTPPDYLEAAQRAFDALGEKHWYELLNENFEIDIDSADEKSLTLPKLIWRLGSNLLITTNVDLVLQSVCKSPHKVKLLDAQATEFAELQAEWRPKRPTVLHLHGHIDNKASVVFTRKQYEAFYKSKKNQAKLDTLRNLFKQRTILFIGFSLDDLFILKELEKANLIYKGGANSFYAVIHEAEKDNRNIPKYVHQINFSGFGTPLEDLIERLSQIAPNIEPEKEDKRESFNPKEAQKNHFNVPFNSKGEAFVGRGGLREKIWESLNTGGCAAAGQAVNIKGIGGLGKTQLAVEYAHAYRNKYENGVFWLTADEDLNNQLITIAKKLSWISQSDTDFNQAELVRNRFRKLSDCLIIFDNVDEPHPLDNYLPESDARPHILITSRKRQSGFHQIELELLERDEARVLLLNVAQRTPETDVENEAFEKILDELGGIPLAIELVGGFLAEHKDISFSEYLELLDQMPLDKLEEYFPPTSFTRHDKSIIRTLKISEKDLAKKPYLEDILDVLAWSGNSSMGCSLLETLAATKTKGELTLALSDLINLRLIKREEEAKRYTIHRLLAKVRRCEKPLKNRKKWHKKIVECLIKWFREKEGEGKIFPDAEIEFDHLDTWQSRTLKCLPAEAVWLIILKAYLLFERGNYQEALKYVEDAQQIYEEEKLTDKLLLAHIYKAFGVSYNFLGKYKEGRTYLKEAIDVYNKNLIDDKKFLADLTHSLGNNYLYLGNYKKALKLFQQALERRQELFGEKHPDVADSLTNLAITHDNLSNYKKALGLREKALKIQQELFGEKHPDIASSLSNLAMSYDKLKNHKKALELDRQALEMRRELFGEKHPDVAISLNNLGISYNDVGKYREALGLKEKALKMRRELFGEKHPVIASSLNDIGVSYRSLGNYKKALELFQQALEMRRELFGEKHPAIASSLNEIGISYLVLGDKDKAIEFYKLALEMRQELLGKQHPKTKRTCRNLIDCLSKMEKTEDAEKLADEFLTSDLSKGFEKVVSKIDRTKH